MGKATMEKPSKDAVIMWQVNHEEGVAEPALLVEFYSDTISIQQDGSSIILNYETVRDLCNLLKSHPKP